MVDPEQQTRFGRVREWFRVHGAIVGYFILSIGIVVGLWLSWNNQQDFKDEQVRQDQLDCAGRVEGRDGIRRLTLKLVEGSEQTPEGQEFIRILNDTLPPIHCDANGRAVPDDPVGG